MNAYIFIYILFLPACSLQILNYRQGKEFENEASQTNCDIVFGIFNLVIVSDICL